MMIEFAVLRRNLRSISGFRIALCAVEISVCMSPGLTLFGVAVSDTNPGSNRIAFGSPEDSVQIVAMMIGTGTPSFDAAVLIGSWNFSQTLVTVIGAPAVRSSFPSTATPFGVTAHETELPNRCGCASGDLGAGMTAPPRLRRRGKRLCHHPGTSAAASQDGAASAGRRG